MKGRKSRGRALGAAGFVLFAAVALVPVRGAAAEDNRNACGCYKDGAGSCYCDKAAKCGCPGECEPKGCEEKRAKEIDKEIRSETKRAEESTRKQGAESAPVPAPAPKKPRGKPVRSLTPKQSRQLSQLLRIYVAGHPEMAKKTVQDLVEELGQGQ